MQIKVLQDVIIPILQSTFLHRTIPPNHLIKACIIPDIVSDEEILYVPGMSKTHIPLMSSNLRFRCVLSWVWNQSGDDLKPKWSEDISCTLEDLVDALKKLGFSNDLKIHPDDIGKIDLMRAHRLEKDRDNNSNLVTSAMIRWIHDGCRTDMITDLGDFIVINDEPNMDRKSSVIKQFHKPLNKAEQQNPFLCLDSTTERERLIPTFLDKSSKDVTESKQLYKKALASVLKNQFPSDLTDVHILSDNTTDLPLITERLMKFKKKEPKLGSNVNLIRYVVIPEEPNNFSYDPDAFNKFQNPINDITISSLINYSIQQNKNSGVVQGSNAKKNPEIIVQDKMNHQNL